MESSTYEKSQELNASCQKKCNHLKYNWKFLLGFRLTTFICLTKTKLEFGEMQIASIIYLFLTSISTISCQQQIVWCRKFVWRRIKYLDVSISMCYKVYRYWDEFFELLKVTKRIWIGLQWKIVRRWDCNGLMYKGLDY